MSLTWYFLYCAAFIVIVSAEFKNKEEFQQFLQLVCSQDEADECLEKINMPNELTSVMDECCPEFTYHTGLELKDKVCLDDLDIDALMQCNQCFAPKYKGGIEEIQQIFVCLGIPFPAHPERTVTSNSSEESEVAFLTVVNADDDAKETFELFKEKLCAVSYQIIYQIKDDDNNECLGGITFGQDVVSVIEECCPDYLYTDGLQMKEKFCSGNAEEILQCNTCFQSKFHGSMEDINKVMECLGFPAQEQKE